MLYATSKIKYKQDDIRKIISSRIASGQYTEKLPGLRELARELDVNVITLRKAIAPLVRSRTLYSSGNRGIYIYRKKRICIGMIGSPLEQSFFRRGGYFEKVFLGVNEIIDRNNDFFSYQSKHEEYSYTELLQENNSVAGLIIFAPRKIDESELTELNGKIPFVIVGSSVSLSVFSFVDSDNFNDSRLCVENLIRNGARRIMFLSDKIIGRSHELRRNGFLAALKMAGIKQEKNLFIAADPARRSFSSQLKDAFYSNNPPDAVFAASSHAAKKMLETDLIAGLPFSLAVYDDPNHELEKFGHPYSVVLQPLRQIGNAAAELLYELIRNPAQKPSHIKIPSQILSRP